jgi:hypothetical protein
MPAYREALRKRTSLIPYLLVTATVRDEVERSRVKVYRDSIVSNHEKPNANAFNIPDVQPHHSDDEVFANELKEKSKNSPPDIAFCL